MMHKQRIAIASGAVAGMFGTFLPWAHLPITGAAISGTAFGPYEGVIGWLTLVLFTIILLLILRGDRRQILRGGKSLAAAYCAALAVLVGGMKTREVVSMRYGIGIGLYIMLAAGFAICVFVFLFKD